MDRIARGALKSIKCDNCIEYGHEHPANLKSSDTFNSLIASKYGGKFTVLSEYNGVYKDIDIHCNTCNLSFKTRAFNMVHTTKKCDNCENRTKWTPEKFRDKITCVTRGEYLVLSDYEKATEKVSVRHTTCGTEYDVLPYHILNGSRCPNCKYSKGEQKIQDFLESRNIRFTTERKFKDLLDRSNLRFDFFVQGVAIEYDGIQHFEPVEHFGGETALRETQRRDRIKDKYCADNGIPLIRIPYWDFDNIDAILTEKLLLLLKERELSQ